MNHVQFECITDIKEELLDLDEKLLSIQTKLMTAAPLNSFSQMADARIRIMRREMTWANLYIDELLKSVEKSLPESENREG